MTADIFESFTSETQWDLPEQSSFQAHPLPPITAQPQIGIFTKLSLGEGVSCAPTSSTSPAPLEVLPVSPFYPSFTLGLSCK